MMDEIRSKIEEAKKNALNVDNWALYIKPEDLHELYDETDLVMRHGENLPWDNIEVVEDRSVEEPVVLPRRPDLMPSDLEFQDNPPLALVQQMVEPEQIQTEPIGLHEKVIIRATVPYEVRKIAYEIPLRKAEDAFSHPELKQVVRQAVEEDMAWEAEVVESEQVWVLSRSYEPGEAVKDVPVMWQGEETQATHLDVEGIMAEDAIDLIGNDMTQSLTSRVREIVEPDSQPPLMMEEDPEPQPMDFEEEEKEVKVGTKRYELGRMKLR